MYEKQESVCARAWEGERERERESEKDRELMVLSATLSVAEVFSLRKLIRNSIIGWAGARSVRTAPVLSVEYTLY